MVHMTVRVKLSCQLIEMPLHFGMRSFRLYAQQLVMGCDGDGMQNSVDLGKESGWVIFQSTAKK